MPEYNSEEAYTHETFLALTKSLSFPGRIHKLPAGDRGAYVAVSATLLDMETSFYTPSAWLADQLTTTGARQLKPDRAVYHFYPDTLPLDQVRHASPGTRMYPNSGAKLIIAAAFNTSERVYLSGPGIPTEMLVRVAGITAGFWTLRETISQYPLGWDIFLIDNDQVMGLPRTTKLRFESGD